MSKKILHYINQFFAGVGGEDMADYKPEVRAGALGPGAQIAKLLAEDADVVATFLCGDNFFATHQEEALSVFDKAMEEYKPDLIVAGPSFYAGRYGFACGHVAVRAAERFGVPTIGGMSVESPAVEMFREKMFIVETGDSARAMKKALEDMTNLARKILRGEPLRTAAEEGYFHRNRRKNFLYEENGGKRAVDMLMRKVHGEAFVSEYLQAIPEKVAAAPAVADLRRATIALLNTGGMVPAGNPDRIEGSAATKFGAYSMEGMPRLESGVIVSVHGGYDSTFSDADPNRIVPLDVLRELEREGQIGKVHEIFYSTVGTGASLLNGQAFGKSIAEMLQNAEVDAAIMVST